MIHVAPAKGITLREPSGMVVPEQGRNFPDSIWWQRRKRDGDAIISPPKKEPKSAKAKGSDK